MSPEAQKLIATIETLTSVRGRLGRELATIDVDTAAPLSEQVSHLYLRMQSLEEQVAAHPTLGNVFRSDIVDSDWALSGPSLDESEERQLPGLAPYFEAQQIPPG